ncbi:Splicing factor 3B subunit 2 [Dinochytrium kinnereticum]|nr:Splicing factor 3B subunit 2 [Dinochytrium kinnereticum]
MTGTAVARPAQQSLDAGNGMNGVDKTLVNGNHGNSKADKDKEKKKRRKKKRRDASNRRGESASELETTDKEDDDLANVEIEYVAAPTSALFEDEAFKDYEKVFERFSLTRADATETAKDEDETAGDASGTAGADQTGAKDEDEEDEEEMSKKKKRLAQRLSVAQLKQLVSKPDVVEWVDITAADPKLLVHLKAYKNTVPIPIHWQQKRKYLQGKRGIEKPPFQLPDFIKATGIMELRETVREKEEAGGLKAKARDRMAPKMGKLDIDYQKLHDAFFRWQTKPPLSIHGDLYYEGKEYETKLKLKKPGQLSDELRLALNIPPNAPPPWLVNMQRYGPPPSYPSLKIAGLNAPIPEGGQWGYHPGGWGKPPVDEYGRPLYGDVFGVAGQEAPSMYLAEIERKIWGELEEEEEVEEEEEEEEEEAEEEGGEAQAGEEEQSFPMEGLATPSGLSSVPAGLETPDFIELRKDRRDEGPKDLYTILPQKDVAVKGFMGSAHTYDLSGVSAPVSAPSDSTPAKKRKTVPGVIDSKTAVEVALNPEDLEGGLHGEAVRKAYEGTVKEKQQGSKMEDFSDMVAEHASRQSKKRRKGEEEKKGKKEKDKFKF